MVAIALFHPAMPPEHRSARFPLPLTLLFVLCLALTGLAAAALITASLELSRSTDQVEHTLKVQQALETLQLTLVNAETGQRGFLLTGQPHFLEPYINAVAKQAYYVGTLERLTADNPQQQRALRALKPLVDQGLQQLAVTLAAYRERLPPTGAAIDALNRSKQLMDQLRGDIEGMRNEEDRVLALRQAEVDRRGRYGIVFLLLSNAASVFGLLVLYMAMRRYHSRRQKMEATLVRSERDFRALFETSAVGQAECDPQTGRILHANRRLGEMTGFSVEALRRTTLFDLLPRASYLDNARAVRKLVAGERDALWLEERATRQDGSTFWAAVHASLVRGDGEDTVRLALVIDDVTDRRNSEEALSKSHALLTAITESTRDSVFAKDVEGRWLLANQALLESLGKARDDVIGKTDLEIFDNAADARWVRAADVRVMSARTAETNEDTVTLGGVPRTYLSTKAPYLDHGGELLGVVGIATEITERKRSELELRQAHDRLAQLVEQRTAQLSELSQWLLRVTEEERATLAMELHDELGSALTALWLDIIGVLNGLRSDAPALVGRQQRALDTLVATSDKMRRLTEGLRPMLLDQLGLTAALQVHLRAWSEATGVDGRCTIAASLPLLPPGAELALFRIAQEALTNVAKYAKARHVILDLQHGTGEVRLTVRDDGVGIPEEVLERPSSHGIAGMRERLRQFEGTLQIGGGPGHSGTEVAATIPVASARREAP